LKLLFLTSGICVVIKIHHAHGAPLFDCQPLVYAIDVVVVGTGKDFYKVLFLHAIEANCASILSATLHALFYLFERVLRCLLLFMINMKVIFDFFT
jgi:hypothetical protein